MTISHTIHLTSHAIERYRDRVRPGLSFEAAELELARVAASGEITTQAPAWHLRNCAQDFQPRRRLRQRAGKMC